MNGNLLLVFGIVVCACLLQQVMMEQEGRTLVDAPYSPDIIKEVPIGLFPPLPRHKRAAACGSTVSSVTEAQKKEILEEHNHWRSQEHAQNELKMEWDDDLASLAQSWADTKQWAHGMLTDCDGQRVGQNMFMESGSSGFPAVNYSKATKSWDSERDDWDFEKQSCKAGKVCGHWSQVVGAGSGKIGCGHAQAPTVETSGGIWTNTLIIVCDYFPAGNVMGQSVFLRGEPCTACTTVTRSLDYRGYKCQNNLCVPCIPKNDDACQCGPALNCQNGGTYSSDSCVCQCPPGFFGAQCENSCTCSDLYGDTCLAWSAQFCADPLYKAFMTTNCAETCNFCNIPASCLA